jgi:uncharacterized Rmd1/YagE family protein
MLLICDICNKVILNSKEHKCQRKNMVSHINALRTKISILEKRLSSIYESSENIIRRYAKQINSKNKIEISTNELKILLNIFALV